MAQEIINTGTTPNDGTGDTLRVSFTKTNNNFTQLFSASLLESNIRITNNQIAATNANGNVDLVANGTGNITFTASNVTIAAQTTLLSSDLVLAGAILTDGSSVLEIQSDTEFFNDIIVGGSIRSSDSTELDIENNVRIVGDLDIEGGLTVAGQLRGAGSAAIEVNSPVIIEDDLIMNSNVTSLSGDIVITSNVIPGSDNVYSLGNATSSWSELHVAGNSIFLGDLVLRDLGGNVFGIFGADGTTQGNISVAPTSNAILLGATTVDIASSNGNVDVITNGNLVARFVAAGSTAVEVYGDTALQDTTTANLAVSGNATITGNLIVTGNTVYTNVDHLIVQDPIIQMGRGANDAPLVSDDGRDRGINLYYFDTAEKSAFFGYQNSTGNLFIAQDVSVSSEVVTVNSYGNLILGNVSVELLQSTGNVEVGNVVAAYVYGDNLEGNVFTAATGNITTAEFGTANANLITVNTIVASGNANAQFFFGDGQFLTNVVAVTGAANLLQEGTSRLEFSGVNGNLLLEIAGIANILTATTSGITVGGTVGNVSGSNLVAANGVFATNVTATTASVTSLNASGNATANYFLGNGSLLTGVITTTGSISNGTSNVSVTQANGNVAVTVAGSANVAVFSTLGLDVSGRVGINGDIVNAGSNATGNIGSSTGYFNTVFAKATSAEYADLAEKYLADQPYVAGTVVSFGGAQELTVSTIDCDRRVAGVISDEPAFRMNDHLQGSHVVFLALAGRVPCRVTGPISRGDMLVSNGDGTARTELDPPIGSVIGKALENWQTGPGIIEIVIGRL